MNYTYVTLAALMRVNAAILICLLSAPLHGDSGEFQDQFDPALTIKNEFILVNTEKTDQAHIFHYQGPDAISFDVFAYPVSSPSRNSPSISPIDAEVYGFTRALPLLVERGLLKAAYPEHVLPIFINIGGKYFEGRKVIARFSTKKDEIQSHFYIFAINNVHYKFRLTVPVAKVETLFVEQLVETWLQNSVHEIVSNGVPTKSDIKNTTATNNTLDVSKVERAKLKSKFGVLGHTTKDEDIFIMINPEILNDKDLLDAVLAHELCHAAMEPSELDAKLFEHSSRFGVTVQQLDLEKWGKEELVCDMTTLAILAEMGNPNAIKKYFVIRELREALVVPFYADSLRVQAEKAENDVNQND